MTAAHDAHGEYNEKLDQHLRMSVIGIRARGYEITLQTQAEKELHANLARIQNAWNLKDLEEITNNYQRQLCEEQVHLDRIDPRAHYNVSTINVPVFAYKQMPAMCFAAGSFSKPVSGAEIERVATRMITAAEEVTQIARSRGQPDSLLEG